MFTGITGHSGALVTTVAALTGAAILRGGAAAADPNQDDQFLALLDEENIPALSNVPSLISQAHKDCRQLDRGMPVDALVDEMTNDAYDVDPIERSYPPDRLTRTMARFIIAAVEAYCPYDKGKIASVVANPAMGSKLSLDRINGPAAWQEPLPHFMGGGVFVAGPYGYDRSDRDGQGPALASLIGAVPPEGVAAPTPPQIPAPPPPTAQPLAPPRPVAPPPPPKKPPPPPQQPPPPPQQVEPPAIGPQPGSGGGGGNSGGSAGGGGGNGGGSAGGGAPAEQSPAPPMPPGFVRLAP
jgi:uncharacterized membrane protein YgcG